jgi:hypothetical protein
MMQQVRRWVNDTAEAEEQRRTTWSRRRVYRRREGKECRPRPSPNVEEVGNLGMNNGKLLGDDVPGASRDDGLTAGYHVFIVNCPFGGGAKFVH